MAELLLMSSSSTNDLPSRMLSSAALAVTPSRMFSSAAVAVTAPPFTVNVLETDSVVNDPAAGVVPPITALSTVPPSKLAVVIVPRLLIVAPLKLTVPLAVRLVNVPATAVEPPITALSIVPALMSAVVAVRSENVPAAAVEAPITVPSMFPPLMSAVGIVTVPVNVGLAVSDLVAIAVDIASNSVSNSEPRITLLVSPPGSVSLAAKSVVLV